MEIIIKKDQLKVYADVATRLNKAMFGEGEEITVEELMKKIKENSTLSKAIQFYPIFLGNGVRITITDEFIADFMHLYADIIVDAVALANKYQSRSSDVSSKWF